MSSFQVQKYVPVLTHNITKTRLTDHTCNQLIKCIIKQLFYVMYRLVNKAFLFLFLFLLIFIGLAVESKNIRGV